MHLPALLRSFFVFFATLFLSLSLFSAFPQQVAAQSNGYTKPNLESDVPRNSHTYTQTVMIDVLSSISCIISGIDPLDPDRGCLGINTETGKIGYAPTPDNKTTASAQPELGGALGMLTDHIEILYTPPASSVTYVQYLADNFGIVKTAHAQQGNPQLNGTGFVSFMPVFPLWKTARDIAYLILVLVFIFIGVAVMLRFKIDPRTTMSIQNQIPKIVICILLITFSYSIAGAMVDLMWASTYVGLNAITASHDVKLPGCGGGGEGNENEDQPEEGSPNPNSQNLSTKATTHLLDTPISYFNTVLHSQDDGVGKCDSIQNGFTGGIFHVTHAVSKATGGIVRDVITGLMGRRDCAPAKALLQVATFGLFGSGAAKDCASKVIKEVFGFIANIASWLIILVALLVTLFRVWFELIKAYIFLLLYVIAAPVWIVMGLIPGRPLGFENWMRNMFVNLAVFPLTAFIFVTARIFMDVFDKDEAFNVNTEFIPPLVGNPHMEHYGTLLAFGMILMAPSLLTILKDKMKVKGMGTGMLGATLATGAGIATAVPKRQWASWNKSENGKPVGWLAERKDAGFRRVANSKLAQKTPGLKGWTNSKLQKKDNAKNFGIPVKDKFLPTSYQDQKQHEEADRILTKRPADRSQQEKDFLGRANLLERQKEQLANERNPQQGGQSSRADTASPSQSNIHRGPIGPSRLGNSAPETGSKPGGPVPGGSTPGGSGTGAAKPLPGQGGKEGTQGLSGNKSSLSVGTLNANKLNVEGGISAHGVGGGGSSETPTAKHQIWDNIKQASKPIEVNAEHTSETAKPEGPQLSLKKEQARENEKTREMAHLLEKQLSDDFPKPELPHPEMGGYAPVVSHTTTVPGAPGEPGAQGLTGAEGQAGHDGSAGHEGPAGAPAHTSSVPSSLLSHSDRNPQSGAWVRPAPGKEIKTPTGGENKGGGGEGHA